MTSKTDIGLEFVRRKVEEQANGNKETKSTSVPTKSSPTKSGGAGTDIGLEFVKQKIEETQRDNQDTGGKKVVDPTHPVLKNIYDLGNGVLQSKYATRVPEGEDDEVHYDSWFKAGAFSDGYQFGDILKTVGSTVGDVGTGMVKGFTKNMEGLVDAGMYGVADVIDIFDGDDEYGITLSDELRASVEEDQTDQILGGVEDFFDKNSFLGDKANFLPEGVGQIASMYAGGALGKGGGLAVTGVSAMGHGRTEAYENDATDGQSWVYGLGEGGKEVVTESIFGGLGKGIKALGITRGIGGLDDMFAKKVADKATKAIASEGFKKVAGNTIEAAIKAGGEGVEEVLSGLGSAVLKKMTFMRDEDLGKLIENEKLLEQFIQGSIISAVVQAPSYVHANKTKTDFVTGQTLSEERAVNTLAEHEIAAREESGEKLKRKDKTKIYDEAAGVVSTVSKYMPGAFEPTKRTTISESRAITETRDRLEALSQNNEVISVEDVKKVTGFGESGAQLVADYANVEGETFSKVESEVKPSYFSGFNNPDLDAAKMPSAFKTEIQMEAYKAGQIDRKMQDLEAEIRAKEATVYEGTFTENEFTKNYTEPECKMISTFAKALRMDVATVDKIIASTTIDENGNEIDHEANASHHDGEMRISANADAGMVLYKMVMHEGGHRMRQLAPKEFGVLMNALYERADGRSLKLGVKQGLMFDNVKAQHDDAGITLDTSGYFEEFAVRELENIFGSAEEFNKWYSEISGNAQVKTAWQKFMDFVSELIENVKRFVAQSKMTKEERAEAKKALSEFEHIKKLYVNAFKAAENAATERADVQTKQGEGAETQKSTDTEGGVNFSLKTFDNQSGAESKNGVVSDAIDLTDNTDLSARIENQRGSEKYKIIRDYILETLGEEPIVLSDGIVAKVDKSDALHLANKSANKKVSYIAKIKTIIEQAKLYAIDDQVEHKKFDAFRYYQANVKYGDDVYPVYLNVGRAKNGDGHHIYDITRKIGAIAKQNNALERVEKDLRSEIDSPISSKIISQNTEFVKSDFSLKDSEGKPLTEAQQEFFKHTKVLDENGNLLVMYQGAAEDFTVFDRKKSSYANLYGRGFYFTKSENHASQYGKTRAFYLNIKHPVSTTETTITKSQLRKFLEAVAENEDYSFENYGYGATVDSVLQSTYGKSDFLMLNDVSQTAIGDLVEAVELFNEVNGTDYDGIMLDTETVIFNSEQAKLTTNENPTSNPDINFSLKQPVEETKNLIAVHNMQVSELERTLDLGGLPMPSIAIIKAQSGHSEYGDVSLIFSKDTIDPKRNKDNKVYGGDAWTPTYPKIEYKPNEKIAKKISDKYYEFSRKFGYDESRPLYSYVHDLERLLNNTKGETAMLDELYNDTSVMQFYLLDSGKGKVENINKETRTELTDAEVKMHEFFIKELGADVVDEVKWDGKSNPKEYRKNYMSKYEGAIREAYKKLLIQDYKFTEEEVQNVLDSTKPYNYLNFVRDAQRYRENGRVTIKTEADYEATQKAIQEAAGEDYRKWVDSLFKGIEEKAGIRNNLSYYTNSGNARSWEVLHWENNLENVVKVMKSQDDTGGGFFGGQGIWGASAKNYRSIEEIKADSDRLKQLPEEEYQKIKDGFGDRMSEIAHSIMSKSERNPFIAVDNAMECIVDAVRNSKTKSGILNNLKQYPQLTVTETTVDDIVALVSDISNMPTEYFEAKPKRVVELNEIATAVIPDNTSQTTKARLDDMGIRYVEYETGNENARLEALNSIEDVQFSLKGTNNGMNAKDRKDLLDIIEHLKGEFEVTKFPKADSKKLAKMTRDILKEYSSHADYDETFKAIDELYQYMANGEDEHPPVWDDVYRRAYKTAQEIVKNALTVDDSSYQEYKPLREYLRTTRIKFYEGFDSVPSAYENFNEFRKKNMGRLNFTNDGRSIDSVYQELSSLYPEFFDEAEQTNSADQLERIVEVLDSIRVAEINPFDGQIEEVSMHLANDLTSRFFDIPQAKPTFADKAERRVVEEKIKGGKKAETLRQQRDEKIKKLIEAQREKTKKQLDRLREQRDTKVKKEREKRRAAISKMSEKQKAKVLRARIMRHTNDLSKKLVKPTDNQHIPHELQGAVATLLESINLESNYTYDAESGSYKKTDDGLPAKRTKAFEALRKLYKDIASSVVVDPDLLGEDGLLSDVISLADKRIADMTSSELETVWQTIRAIEASISTANKAFSKGKFETILGFAEALREDNVGKKEKTELKGVLGSFKNLATLNMLTPEIYFHYLGDAGDSIFRMMRDAQDKHISIMKEVADFTHETFKDVDVNALEKELHTIKLGGEEVKLSTAQLMELYVLMKREQAVEHIMVGGILPDVTDGKGLKKNTKAEPVRNISGDEISAALSKLTGNQKKIADELQKFVSTVLSAYGNEASMKVYNYEKFNEKNYWTIRTNKQEINTEIGKDTAVTSVANKGMTKATKPHANNSVRIGSIFDTFASHSSDMATYAAWLGTSEDVNRIRNFAFWDDGKRTGTVKGILDTVHGAKVGSEYLEKLLTDIAIGVKGTDNMNPFDKFVGGYKAASVGANLRVIIQQPTAILRALDMIDSGYIAKGAIRPLKGWEKAKKYAPIAQWKDWGYFDINTGRQMKDVLFDNASKLEKAKQVGMWGASMADSLAWGQLWNAVEAETKATHKELEVGSDSYYEAVAKRFTEIIDHTQVVDGILQRSQIMRSSDALTKMATSFMGEPTKQYNMAVSAVYDAKHGKGDARKKAMNRLGRTAMSLAVAGIVNACAQSIIDAMRDDDKEKDYWEKWLAAFAGDGEDNKFINSNVADTVNPLSYIPFAKDAWSIIAGYDVKRMDTETIAKTYSAIKNMYKAVTGTGKYTVAEASAQLFAEAARFYGLPVANVKRDIKSLVTTFAIETNSYLMQYRMEKAMLDINYAGNSKNFMDILFNAYNNDREAYEIIYDDMLKSGYDIKKIQSGMETRIKKAEGVEKASELTKRYMTPENEKKYDSTISQVKSSHVWKSANAEQKKSAEAYLYSFLTGSSEDMEKMRAEAKALGIDETEYTLWQLAKEVVNKDGNDTLSNKERTEAMKILDLDSDTEWDLYLLKNESKGATYARDEGIQSDTYADFIEALYESDKPSKNGKYGSFTQEEATAAIEMLDGLSRKEKAILWQSVNTDWKEKNNPFR